MLSRPWRCIIPVVSTVDVDDCWHIYGDALERERLLAVSLPIVTQILDTDGVADMYLKSLVVAPGVKLVQFTVSVVGDDR